VGANGGLDGTAEAVWLFPPEAYDIESAKSLIGFDAAAFAPSVAVAGVLNPDTKMIDREGEYFYHGREPVWRTRPRTTFRYLTGGGGGWGDPLMRDAGRVLNDVRDEYVSIQEAAARYGVVVSGDPINDPEGITLDITATEGRRAELARSR
jgi:N-methylhydantoinase B